MLSSGMPMFERGEVRLNYSVSGAGETVLLIAPGGMRSGIDAWQRSPWHPVSALADRFRVVAMDQRNTGLSTAPVSGGDGWKTYTQDQLALMDHLEVERFSVVGMCIGGPYIMGLIRAAPTRIRRAVLLQPVGLENNREAFYELFDGWAHELAAGVPDVTAETWSAFRHNMFGGEFMFSVTPQDVAACQTPLLVLRGDDLYHPESTSRDIVRLAPNAKLIENWKSGTDLERASEAIREFLADTH